MSNKDFRCARITGQATSLRVKGKRCGNNCLKGMNIGSGWEQKSIEQKSPFIFIIRTENSRNNQTVGRKATLRLRIIPKTTGSYFIIVSVEESPAARTHWALAYGFR